MLAKLFRRLTSASGPDDTRLFAALTDLARQPHWYLDGEVPDTIDGRFAVLATVSALAVVRLESEGAEGDRLSAALIGRFAQVMDSEHRELGVGEPTLGKTVLKLVGALAKRVELWRSATPSDPSWRDATVLSLSLQSATSAAIDHDETALKELHRRFAAVSLVEMSEGRLG